MFKRRVTAAIVLCLVARSLYAQAPPASPPAAPPAAPIAPPPLPGSGGFVAPGKTSSSRTLSFGGSFNSAPFNQGDLGSSVPGLTGAAVGLQGEQYSFQTQLSLMWASNLQAVDVEASYLYAVAEPLGKVMDVPRASVDYNFRRKDGQRYFFLTRYAWYKDDVRHIDYSHQGLVGLGIEAVDARTAKLTLSPVVGLLHERKGVPQFDGRWLTGWGGIERLVLTPNPYVQLEQREGFVEAFNDSTFRVLESYAGLKAQVAKRLAVTFGLTHTYDNALAQAVTTLPIPGGGLVAVQANNRTQVMTTAGIQITF